MFRTFATQVPKMAATACQSSAGAPGVGVTPAPRRINRRLEVDLPELQLMQVLEDLTLIDVRQPTELLHQDQIPGSLHIPLGNLRQAFQMSDEEWLNKYEQPKPKKLDKAIVFYGRGHLASSAAVEIAHRLGYKKSRHYYGGWEDYVVKNNIPFNKQEQTLMAETEPEPNRAFSFYDPQLYYYPK